jgi:hypothetical protein
LVVIAGGVSSRRLTVAYRKSAAINGRIDIGGSHEPDPRLERVEGRRDVGEGVHAEHAARGEQLHEVPAH